MEYGDTPEQAADFAARALDEMRRRAIPPTPNNFAVWYMHVSARMPVLSQALQNLDDAGRPFSERDNADLHGRFFTADAEEAAISDTAAKLNAEMTHVIGHISTAGEDAGSYGLELGKAIESMVTGESSEDLNLALASVLTTTKSMEMKNRALEEKLRHSAAEVTRLRSDMESLREDALLDPLTGIANRRMFDQALRQAVVDAMETGEPLALAMLDIDHFKNFNDTHGHQTGDQVLRLVAATLGEVPTGGNMVGGNSAGATLSARYGGEEFAVVAPGMDLADAVRLTDGIRQEIGGKVVRNRRTGEDLGQITISAGVAAFAFGEPIGLFIGRADRALYAAKNAGRNCVRSEADVPNGENAADISVGA